MMWVTLEELLAIRDLNSIALDLLKSRTNVFLIASCLPVKV